MIQPATLTKIAKRVASDMVSQRLSADALRSVRNLEDEPEHVFDLVDLLAKEGRKKRPSDKLIGGYAFLLASGLEILRYGIDGEHAETIELVERLRRRLVEAGAEGRVTPAILLLILHQFASAKLDVGDDLRDLMQQLMENDGAAADAVEDGAAADYFAHMAEGFGGDPFAIHACLEETIETVPEAGRVALIMATFAATEPSVREASIGFLLHASAEVRKQFTGLLELAAPNGLVTPIMLRRMIAVRNWLPAADHKRLDKVIKAARKAGVECASWPRANVQHVLSSGVDGSGCLSLLVIAEEAGCPLVAGLLIKQGFGVRDTWVRRNISAADLRETVQHIVGEIGIEDTSLDYARTICRQALAISHEAGHVPPFGLLNCAEAIGLVDLNPDPLPVEKLVADLIADVDAGRLSAVAVTKVLSQSAGWPEHYPMMNTWFEGNVAKLIGTKRLARAKRIDVLLAGPLQARRRRWAELAAWMALSLKHQHTSGDWQGFAILARELLGTRPLDEIGLMRAIADTTLAVLDMHDLPGTDRAA